MFFMNDFVEQQIPNMKKLIMSISVSCVVSLLPSLMNTGGMCLGLD